MLGLVAFGLRADLLEGAARVWTTIYLRDAFDVPALVGSISLPALILTRAVVRLVVDPVIDRQGAAPIACLSLAVTFAGVTLVALAPAAGARSRASRWPSSGPGSSIR